MSAAEKKDMIEQLLGELDAQQEYQVAVNISDIKSQVAKFTHDYAQCMEAIADVLEKLQANSKSS